MARNLYDDAGRLVGVIDGAGNTNRFIHDIANRIETVIDPLGFGLTNYYDPRGGITMTVNALGQTNQFSHNDDNRLIYAVNPLGHTNSYGYDENGYRDAITNELGEITRFDFDSFGQLLSKTDALTNTTSFEYNSTGRRTAVEDALGNRTSFTHDAFGRPTAVTNALQQLRAAAGSDELGDLLFVRQEGGLRMDFARDLNGNTTNTSFVWINPDNTNQTQNLDTITEFDPAGRITRVVDPDNLERLTVYDHAGRVQYSVNRMGSTNAFLYDALGNVIETSYEDGTVERSVYDARFQVLFTMDRHQPGSPANGTHNVYDALGRVTRTERLADVQIEINQNGVAPGSVLVSTGAVLAASSTAFDAAGRARFTTNALNHVTEFMYDDAGRQTVVIDALTNRTDYAYDEAGRLRFITNALDQAMRYDYDAKGRQIKIIFPDNSFVTNSYNEIGQLVAVKDQADLTTDNEYDGLGRLKAVLKPQVFDPEGGTNARPRVEYGYDSYGNIRTIRDPKGRETTFTYDSFGQLLSRELPLSQIESSLYNALGQLTNKVDFKGQTNRVAYDSLGRVATNWLFASGASTAGQTNSFEYLPNGRLFRITRPEGTTTFGYNLEGAVTNIVSPEGTLNYEYNQAAGYLTRVYTVKTDIQYAYDELSRLKTVTVAKRNGVTLGTPEVTTNTYTAIGQIENVYFPNGTRSFHEYDSLNYLTNLVQYGTGGQVLAHYKYTVASDGRRLAATERRLESGGGYSTNQITWNYDDVRRLTREEFASTISGLSYTNSYVYDLAGNRLWKTNMSNAGTEVISYDYNDNDQLLTEASSVNGTFTNYYDLNGSLTNRSSNAETNLYTYNLEGRLAIAVMLRMESGSSVQQTNNYFYNHTGIRVRTETARRVNGGALVNETNVFLNDPLNPSGFSQVLEQLPAVGAAPSVTYTLGHRVLSQEKGGTVSHLVPDGHGSTRLLTGSGGTISHRYTYDAYGVALDFTPGVLNAPQTAVLYSGEQLDVGVRQYYLRARYYNPAVGRFNRMDSFGGVSTDPQSLHKYAYAHNDPVNLRDPSGNFSLSELSIASYIAVKMEWEYIKVVAKHGYVATKKATELGVSRGSILDAAARNPSPDADSAAIIVHGVSNKEHGWSDKPDPKTGTSFQEKLTLDSLNPRIPGIGNSPLNHDFYEFNWGGFSIGGFGAIPIKSVHQMALVHLEMAQFLVWMNGYDNIDLISHSWGTTLTYDLQNVSGIAVRHWVTMGSPLKSTTPKPPSNTGNWINLYDLNDPVVHFEMFPPFPDVSGLPLPSWGPGLTINPSVSPGLNTPYNFRASMGPHIWVHSDYWVDSGAVSDLRKWLQ